MRELLNEGVDPDDVEPTADELYEIYLLNMMWLDADKEWNRLGGKCPVCQESITIEDIFHGIPCGVCSKQEIPF